MTDKEKYTKELEKTVLVQARIQGILVYLDTKLKELQTVKESEPC